MEHKFKIHFPCEQYGFIEHEFYGEFEDAVQFYKDLRDEWNKKEGEGLNTREWRQFIVRYAKKGTLESGDYEILEKLSPEQKRIINDYKLTFNAIKNEDKPMETKYQTNK